MESYEEYSQELLSLCKEKKLPVKSQKLSNGFRFYYISIGDRNTAERSVCFSSGIHGNEKGGPYGVLNYLKEYDGIPDDLHVLIFPVVNPYGFDRDIRPNAMRMDINRRFCDGVLTGEARAAYKLIQKFEVKFLCTLHESGLSSYYMYVSDPILRDRVKEMPKIASKYFKVFDSRQINNEDVKDGIIWHPTDGYSDNRSRCTLENKAYTDGIHYICTETPWKAELEDRAKCQCELIHYVLENFGA